MKTYVNLLPADYQRRKLLRLRIAQWAAIWSLGLVVGAGWLWNVYGRYDREQSKFQTRERRYAPVARLTAEIATLEKQMKTLAAQEKSLEWLRTDHPALTLLGFISRSAAQCAGQVTVEQLRLRPASDLLPFDSAPTSNASALSLEGIGLDNLAVARFVVALRETSAFTAVELKSTEKKGPEGKQTCAYVVECAF